MRTYQVDLNVSDAFIYDGRGFKHQLITESRDEQNKMVLSWVKDWLAD